MYDILRASQAARVIGCGAPEVRHKLRIGVWKFGRVISPKESGTSQCSYEINKRGGRREKSVQYKDLEEIDSLN